MIPTVIVGEDRRPAATIGSGDAVIFFNFRADRARELTWAFTNDEFDGFERPGGKLDLCFVTMAQYDVKVQAPFAYPPQNLDNTLGEYLSKLGYRQLRIAETEKYAHVTYFFNGGIEKPYPGEDRKLIPSPKVATYDLKPEMSAPEVTAEVVERINSDQYDLIVLNYANGDMVGHTGCWKRQGGGAVDDWAGAGGYQGEEWDRYCHRRSRQCGSRWSIRSPEPCGSHYQSGPDLASTPNPITS